MTKRDMFAVRGRLFASGALAIGALAFGVTFGPRFATPVYADIYAPLANAAGFFPPPPAESSRVRVGRALVNGQAFQYAIGHSKLALDDVLSHYEEQFKLDAGDPSRPVRTATRVSGPGAGVVTGIRFRPLAHPKDVGEGLLKFAQTKRLNDFGRFHVISAYGQKGTVFIDFTPGDDVRLDKLLPAGTEDAPGVDLEGIRRPHNLQRLMTIDHGEGSTWSRTLIYRAADGAAAAADFRSALAAAGWTPNQTVASDRVAHYVDGRRESFVGGLGAGNNSVVILVYRMLSPEKNQ